MLALRWSSPGILARAAGVDVVFAVYMSGRHAPVRAGVVPHDPGTAGDGRLARYSSLTVYLGKAQYER